MVDDHIRMSMPDLNDEDYFPPVTDLEDDEYEEGPGDDDSPEYPSDDEDVSDTEDGIPYQDKNLLVGKILAAWKNYKPILEHDYSREGYILYVDASMIKDDQLFHQRNIFIKIANPLLILLRMPKSN